MMEDMNNAAAIINEWNSLTLLGLQFANNQKATSFEMVFDATQTLKGI